MSGENMFLQWLEGKKEDIQILMARIYEDSRHRDILILSESEDVRERLFPSWKMKFVEADDISNVLSRALHIAKDAARIEALRFLLKQLNPGGLLSLTTH